jgi:hypothetical protein
LIEGTLDQLHKSHDKFVSRFFQPAS